MAVIEEKGVPSMAVANVDKVPSLAKVEEYGVPSTAVAEEHGVSPMAMVREEGVPPVAMAEEHGVPPMTVAEVDEVPSSAKVEEHGVPSTAVAEEDGVPSRRRVTVGDSEVPPTASAPEEQDTARPCPGPEPAPHPAIDLTLHIPHTRAATVVVAIGPASAAPVPPRSSSTTVRPGSVLSVPRPLPGLAHAVPRPDRSAHPGELEAPSAGDAPCTAMVLATSRTILSLPPKGARVVFMVPGLDASSSLPGMPTPRPRQAQPCTAMVLVSPRKAGPHRATAPRLVESVKAAAAPRKAFRPPVPAVHPPLPAFHPPVPILLPVMADIGPRVCAPASPEPEEEAEAAPHTWATYTAADLDALDLAVTYRGFRPVRNELRVKTEGFPWKLRRGEFRTPSGVLL
ncbi:uncharacterized protein LOC127538452 [Antechinus flavipes]|uniref:uncharacterized protein LOC127538452 n=1 Tax=Antechinus flavipes TaxID=38775 RepID=UPI00223608B5|nr:uncharacterized protein LOC127538452 [Antechinus flavipes]